MKQLGQNRKFKYRQPYFANVISDWVYITDHLKKKGTQLNSEVNIFYPHAQKYRKVDVI